MTSAILMSGWGLPPEIFEIDWLFLTFIWGGQKVVSNMTTVSRYFSPKCFVFRPRSAWNEGVLDKRAPFKMLVLTKKARSRQASRHKRFHLHYRFVVQNKSLPSITSQGELVSVSGGFFFQSRNSSQDIGDVETLGGAVEWQDNELFFLPTFTSRTKDSGNSYPPPTTWDWEEFLLI